MAHIRQFFGFEVFLITLSLWALVMGIPARAVPALDKAPKLSVETTADGLTAYVAHFRRMGYTVTFDQELFDRHGSVLIFRFAARRRIPHGSRRVTAVINGAKGSVRSYERDEMTYHYPKKP